MSATPAEARVLAAARKLAAADKQLRRVENTLVDEAKWSAISRARLRAQQAVIDAANALPKGGKR